MNKFCTLVLALTLSFLNVYADEDVAAAEEKYLPMNDVMKQFSSQYGQALANDLKIKAPEVVFMDNNGKVATIIKYHGFINLRESRIIIMKAADIADQLVQQNPQYQAIFPDNKFDLNTANIVIDNYDEKLPKDKQGGISSVVLVNGWLQFRGISQRNGTEILLHKEPLSDAKRIVSFSNKK